MLKIKLGKKISNLKILQKKKQQSKQWGWILLGNFFTEGGIAKQKIQLQKLS
jgi:hypothetical protein